MTRASPGDALAAMQSAPWYRGQLASRHEIPSRPARTVPVPGSLHEAVRAWLSSRGVDRLYTHQAAVFEAATQGRDVAVATSTASGKTLAFLLPVLDRLAADEDAAALFLYPLKALANDQLQVLREAESASGLCLEPALYDGDTPKARRPRVRQFSRVILTNPYEIHETLPQHHLWRRFFANLKYVVVDEAHRYTGVFGSNVAQVFRRLLRVAGAYGPPPAFIAASASIANPGEHASALTGRDCAVVDDDGAPAGPRTLAFFDTAAEGAGSALVQTRDVFLGLVGLGLKTLCFTQSRKGAELVASLAFEGKGPRLPIAPYRAGYLPDERRRLEADFREGRLRGVVSTSALELGIDIGDLDAVVISGYPGTVSGFWQQAGRAGRRSAPSLTVFVARQDIIDQYLLRHPEPLLGRTYERATVDLENEHILAGHLLCAASELPVPEPPEPAGTIARELAGRGMLHKTEAGYVYAGLTRPHQAVRLDRIGDVTITLVDADTDRPLETLDFGRALREAFAGAVYLHGGETWVSEDLDLQALVARLRRRDVGFYTQALTSKVAEILETRNTGASGQATVSA
jgi:DEAD/DEAH box helicase domain-containing protein